jgi:3-dehydroquinate synthase
MVFIRMHGLQNGRRPGDRRFANSVGRGKSGFGRAGKWTDEFPGLLNTAKRSEVALEVACAVGDWPCKTANSVLPGRDAAGKRLLLYSGHAVKSTARTIPVKTSTAEYPVIVGRGLFTEIPRRMRLDRAPRRVFVLTSPEIWSLWGRQLLAALPGAAAPTALFLPAGERYKRMAQVERLATEMAEAGADRSSVLIAFGGGIVGDVGGFLAAIYMRGIDYVQVPTTLLAQVDSSVGGKTGVNLTAGKNLAGSFHHPRAVFADIDVLQTLPESELRAGLFESVKAGIIRDAPLFRFMEHNAEAILRREPAALERVIGASIRMKAGVVAIDERESGLRMILNFGHTLGHAIEAATGYRRLLHGEAIAWGMLAALRIALQRGTVAEDQVERIETTIAAYGPLPPFRTTTDKLLDAAGRDKKNRAGKRRFVLPKGIGDAVVVEDVTGAEMEAAARWVLDRARSSKHD